MACVDSSRSLVEATTPILDRLRHKSVSWAPFFIVGCARSGTTMLQRLLNRHSQICVPGETHFIPQELGPFLKRMKRGQRQHAVRLLNSLPLIVKWEVRVDADDITGLNGESAYARAVKLLMSRRAAKEGKPYWGEKTPWYLLEIPLLHRLFPEARFIHIQRDGRDVALSVMPLRWGPNNAYSCARWWQHHIRAWLQAKPILGSNALDVCYEELIYDPELHLRRICEFLNVSYEDGMLSGFVIKANNSGKWRNTFNMTAHELEAFEYVAGDLLNLLEYERGIEKPHWPMWLRLFSVTDNVYKALSNVVLRRGIRSN